MNNFKKLVGIILALAVLTVIAMILPKSPEVALQPEGNNQVNQIATFVPSTLEVGDVVAGMTVESIGPANSAFPISFDIIEGNNLPNFQVKFVGQKTLSGTYTEYSPIDGGRVIMLDEKSEASLPHIFVEGPEGWIDNKIHAVSFADEERFSVLGEGGTGTFQINEYTIIAYPSDYGGYYVSVEKVIDYQRSK